MQISYRVTVEKPPQQRKWPWVRTNAWWSSWTVPPRPIFCIRKYLSVCIPVAKSSHAWDLHLTAVGFLSGMQSGTIPTVAWRAKNILLLELHVCCSDQHALRLLYKESDAVGMRWVLQLQNHACQHHSLSSWAGAFSSSDFFVCRCPGLFHGGYCVL